MGKGVAIITDPPCLRPIYQSTSNQILRASQPARTPKPRNGYRGAAIQDPVAAAIVVDVEVEEEEVVQGKPPVHGCEAARAGEEEVGAACGRVHV
jgi:hypothetical protein